MKKNNKGFDKLTLIYATGTYFLGVSVVFFINIILEFSWYTNLFFLLCFFPASLILMSKSKRMNRELKKKEKKEARKKK